MKIAQLNYRFNDGGIEAVNVGFENWGSDITYNITVNLTPEDADFSTATPSQLAKAAKEKIAALVVEE